MREIKFRAWLKNRKVMGKVLEIHFGKEITVYAMKDGLGKTWFEEENENVVIMQYTGLKDKNGVDIYEGDIIKDKYGQVYGVYFKYGVFWWSIIPLLDVSEPIEVIGNTTENPELLEVDKW